jgi:hypothetical protein
VRARSISKVKVVLMATAAVLALGAGVGADPARAAAVLAQEWAPSKVSHFAGMTAWSRLDPQAGLYRLVIHDGEREHVPLIKTRSVPFDVDLGPDRRGDVVATYSRCKSEPRRGEGSPPLPVWATGKGCDLFLYSLKRGSARVETKIRGASTDESSEFLPSIWRGQVAFSRVYERREGRRGTLPYLYVRELESSERSARQPGGARGQSGLPGPTALDLYGRRLGFAWVHRREGEAERSEIRLDTLGAGHRVVAWVKDFSRTDFSLLTPSLDRGEIFWGTDCQGQSCADEPQPAPPGEGRSAFVSREPIERPSRQEGIAFLDDGLRLVSVSRDKGRAALLQAAGYSTTDGQMRCRSEQDPQRSSSPGCQITLRDDLEYGGPRA